MSIPRRVGFTASLCLAGFFSVAHAIADEAFDASKLPRMPGQKEIYASPATTIFTVPGSVRDASDATLKALTDIGWQSYGPISASQSDDPNMYLGSLKKGAQGLSLFINLAPAQNNATSVTYNAVPIAHDLPFPKDATDIRFDDGQAPHLACDVASDVTATSDFFRTELLKRGWSPWSKEHESKAAYADVKTEKGLFAYYVHDQQTPMILTLNSGDNGKTAVNLESIDPDLIVAKKPEPPKPEQPKAPDKTDDAFDALTKNIMEQAQKSVADALAGAKAPSPKSESSPAASGEALTPLAGNTVPIPVPANAANIEFEGTGNLAYDAPASIQQLAAFYRAQMKSLGWSEQKSVINQANMVVLEFHKGEKEVSLTALQMGASVNVTATGSALEVAKADDSAPATNDATISTDDAKASDKDIEAEMTGGLPVPKDHSSSGTESSMFRHGANASTSAKLSNVLAFYRRELTKLGWKEDESKADIKADAATLHYTTAEGPAVLTLGRVGGETTIAVVVRQTEKAKKSGMMAKAGQVKLLIGNILDTPASITIAGKTIVVKGGAGSKGPDGPTMEVAPGKYTYTIKGTANDAPAEPVVVGADEIWGLMIGPGGVLPIQMY